MLWHNYGKNALLTTSPPPARAHSLSRVSTIIAWKEKERHEKTKLVGQHDDIMYFVYVYVCVFAIELCDYRDYDTYCLKVCSLFCRAAVAVVVVV